MDEIATLPITTAFADELYRSGAGRLARVLLDVAERGVNIRVALVRMPHEEGYLFVDASCANKAGPLTDEERERLAGAAVTARVAFRLYEHCGCGNHRRGIVRVEWRET